MTEPLNVDVSIAKKINKDISAFLLEAKELDLKRDIKHPDSIKSCQLINYYSFNNTSIKVCFDTEETKSLIHQKYRYLDIDNTNNYDVEYKIFNNANKLFIFNNDQLIGTWDKSELHEFQ